MSNLARKINRDVPPITVRDAIYSRRATRHFLAQAVPENRVKLLIDAAIHAPSSMNLQPWAFVVIQRTDLLKRISDEAKQIMLKSTTGVHLLEKGHIPLEDPKFDIFYQATTLVVIYARSEPGFSPEGDCFLAGENLMLAAYEMGLATCPIGFARDVLDKQSWRDELSIPINYDPVLPIIVGFPSSTMPSTLRGAAKVFSWLR